MMLAYAALGAAALCWGLSFVFTKFALEGLPPFTILFLRFALATLVFAAILLRRRPPRLSLAQHGRALLISLFMPGAYFALEVYGVKHTTASKASLIDATIPILVLLLSAAFLRERPSALGAAGAAASLAGVTLLVFGGTDAAGLAGAALGDWLMLGAALAASLYMLLTARLARDMDCWLFTGLQMAWGMLFFSPFFIAQAPGIDWAAVGPKPLLAVAALTCLANVGAFLSYNYALTQTSAARASLFINAVPVVTALGAWLLLGERLTALQALGGALAVAAAYAASLAGREKSVDALADAEVAVEALDRS